MKQRRKEKIKKAVLYLVTVLAVINAVAFSVLMLLSGLGVI